MKCFIDRELDLDFVPQLFMTGMGIVLFNEKDSVQITQCFCATRSQLQHTCHGVCAQATCIYDMDIELHPMVTLQWRHINHGGVWNHQPHGCLLNRLFRRRSKKTSKLRVTGLCVGNSPGPVNSPHKGPVTRKMVPFDDVIMMRCKLSKFSLRASSTNRWSWTRSGVSTWIGDDIYIKLLDPPMP